MLKQRPSLPPTVYIDGYLGYFLSEDPKEVELYQTSWTNMSSMALDEAQTRQFL